MTLLTRILGPALLAVAALAAPARAIDIQPVQSPGGQTAWLVQDDTIPFVALTLMFRGGASMDATDARGATTLMTALLEEGAGQMDATAFAEAAESLGARLRFDTSDDAVTVSMQALTENRDQVAALLASALSQPRFDEPAIRRVKAQMQAIIRAEATDPQAIAAREMAAQAWGDHPYATSVNGTEASLARLTRADLVAAKNRVLARDRVVIGASGDISADELGALVDAILGKLPEKATAPLPDAATMGLTGGVTIIDWDSPQTVMAFAGPGLPMDDPDYFAAFVADHILGGGGFSSRLMDAVRERRGLTYGIGTGLANGLYGQTWEGGSAVANANVAQVIALTRQIWSGMADGVTEAELADAKTYLTGEYPLRFDGNAKIAGLLAGMQLIGLPIDYPNTRNDRVNAVTADDVARVAARLLDGAGLRFVLVGRPEGVSATDATTAETDATTDTPAPAGPAQ